MKYFLKTLFFMLSHNEASNRAKCLGKLCALLDHTDRCSPRCLVDGVGDVWSTVYAYTMDDRWCGRCLAGDAALPGRWCTRWLIDGVGDAQSMVWSVPSRPCGRCLVGGVGSADSRV